MTAPDDLVERARRLLDPVHFDFFAGGAGGERTLAANEESFARRFLLPRILRGTGEPELTTTLFGTGLSMPILVAPTAFHALAHPDGEEETARGVAAAGTAMVVSMAATRPVERMAEAGGPLWFQLYPQPDAAFTEYVVKRAEAAGCQALVVTADSPVFGRRERDLRNGFLDLPPGLVCENMRDATGRVRDIAMDPALDWGVLGRLRAMTGLPLLVKGVLHPDDARLAIEHGADGVIVSNHGGRQLDGAVPTLDALPAVVAAVDGRVPVLLDGGVRRGEDALVALALGATAVLVGRPVVWALAADGAHGVREMLEGLGTQLARALTLAGAQRTAELRPSQVVTR